MGFDRNCMRGFPLEELTPEQDASLRQAAATCGSWAVTMTAAAGSGHPAGSLSSMQMYLAVYGAADITPERFQETDRDYVVISHGHTSPGAYAALGWYGFFDPLDAMAHFRQAGGAFQGHVERCVPGIDWGSGNLGQGLAAGVGFALAQKSRKASGHVYVLMSDGEQVKGQVAEARRAAVGHGLSNITALVDYNHIQISGHIEQVMPSDIRSLWEADGWLVIECDGHDPSELYAALKTAVSSDVPAVVLCRTVMGKGVSFMEGIPDFHGKAPSGDLFVKAMQEMQASPDLLENAKEKRKTGTGPDFGARRTPCVLLHTGNPRSYGPDILTDNRSAFGAALADIGKMNCGGKGSPVLVFDCDLAGSVKEDAFSRECPEWFVEMGIQEHATATAAGAASCAGVSSLWADFGVFGLSEVYNQQRLNDINGTNLKLVLTHVGLDVGEDGMTHQCIDYLGLLRNTFGWKVLVPADPNQTDRMVRWALAQPGNVCIAMGRSNIPVVQTPEGAAFFAEGYEFSYGGLDMVRAGKDASVVCMGHTVSMALEARDILADRGVDTAVYHAGCPLALDPASLEPVLRTGNVVTIEDHHVKTGLGSIVQGVAADSDTGGLSLSCLGVSRWGDSGASRDVLANMGLTADAIAARILER
ncbi:MAG: transketolase [Synergistota bacterium]|nr:transketolase [Synergistota bacterium]